MRTICKRKYLPKIDGKGDKKNSFLKFVEKPKSLQPITSSDFRQKELKLDVKLPLKKINY